MSDNQASGGKNVNAVAVAVAVALFGLLIWLVVSRTKRDEQNQQVKRPPGIPADPLLERIPKIASEMQGAKSSCEDQALAAMDKRAKRRITDRQLDKGRDLYRDAKTRVDECLTHLIFCMERGFEKNDLPVAKQKTDAANQAVIAFSSWYMALDNQTGAGNPLGGILDLFLDLEKQNSAENWKAIDRLKSELNKCRLLSWSDLERQRTGALDEP